MAFIPGGTLISRVTHPLPPRTANPTRSSTKASASASKPAKLTARCAGFLSAPNGAPCNFAIPTFFCTPCQKSFCAPPASFRNASPFFPHSSTATPNPTIAGRFSVPARRSPSCLPPSSHAAQAVPDRIHKAPEPFGPPNRCPDNATKSAPLSSTEKETQPAP